MGLFLDVICKITHKNWIEQDPEHENSSSTRVNVRFAGFGAKSSLEFKGGEVGFVDFAEAEWIVKSERRSNSYDSSIVVEEPEGVFVVVDLFLFTRRDAIFHHRIEIGIILLVFDGF